MSEVARKAVAAWTRVEAALAPIIGHNGVFALFRRSVALARADYSFLTLVPQVLPPLRPRVFSALGVALSAQHPAEAPAANQRLLRTFREQLGRLIGESLTERLLRPIWSDIYHDPPLQEPQP